MYSHNGRNLLYYGAIIEDSILRFSWVGQLTLLKLTYIEPLYIKTGTLLLEVIRRFIWNFFRLENEHLNNCGKFRAVRDIMIGPIR